MKNFILILLALTTLSACTSRSSNFVEGTLVSVLEDYPKFDRCEFYTTLVLQTAQSGQQSIQLREVEAIQFNQYIGKEVIVHVQTSHTFGCGKSTVSIKPVESK